jgi:hypothetical protein
MSSAAFSGSYLASPLAQHLYLGFSMEHHGVKFKPRQDS